MVARYIFKLHGENQTVPDPSEGLSVSLRSFPIGQGDGLTENPYVCELSERCHNNSDMISLYPVPSPLSVLSQACPLIGKKKRRSSRCYLRLPQGGKKR